MFYVGMPTSIYLPKNFIYSFPREAWEREWIKIYNCHYDEQERQIFLCSSGVSSAKRSNSGSSS